MTHQPKFVLMILFMLFAMVSSPVFSQEEEAAEEETVEEGGVTDYIGMEPAFVTHVGTPGNKPTYLKAAVSLRAGSTSTRPAVEAHMPRLRHELVMLFGEQTDVNRLTSLEGQQALREEATRRINAVLEEQQTGEQIVGVLFTEFVVQK
jgi:flagellar FliL protein